MKVENLVGKTIGLVVIYEGEYLQYKGAGCNVPEELLNVDVVNVMGNVEANGTPCLEIFI